MKKMDNFLNSLEVLKRADLLEKKLDEAKESDWNDKQL